MSKLSHLWRSRRTTSCFRKGLTRRVRDWLSTTTSSSRMRGWGRRRDRPSPTITLAKLSKLLRKSPCRAKSMSSTAISLKLAQEKRQLNGHHRSRKASSHRKPRDPPSSSRERHRDRLKNRRSEMKSLNRESRKPHQRQKISRKRHRRRQEWHLPKKAFWRVVLKRL